LNENLPPDVERLDVDLLRHGAIGILAVAAALERRDSASDAEIEAPAAHLVEHADLLRQTQRIVERQAIHHRTEAQPLRALADARQEHAGRRRHAERREVMLGDMIAVESQSVVSFDGGEAVLVELAQRRAAAVHVIEDADVHARVLPVRFPPSWPRPRACQRGDPRDFVSQTRAARL
jgi:hypothetical protein